MKSYLKVVSALSFICVVLVISINSISYLGLLGIPICILTFSLLPFVLSRLC